MWHVMCGKRHGRQAFVKHGSAHAWKEGGGEGEGEGSGVCGILSSA